MILKSNFFFIITLLIFTACSSLKEANKILRNEKIKSTDEFLVEKKDPLVFPPDYEKMPEPGRQDKKEKIEEEKIKKMLKKKTDREPLATSENSSVENSILDKIRK